MCMALPSAFPRAHDRHGRTPRYVRLFPGLPVWKTRRESFDSTVALVISELTERWPEVATIEFATEDVPPSDPAPWEDHGVVLARVFPADRRKGLGDRIVLYRLPITMRIPPADLYPALRALIAERVSHILYISPEELDSLS